MLVGRLGRSSGMKCGNFDVVVVVEDAGVGREIHQVPLGSRTDVGSPPVLIHFPQTEQRVAMLLAGSGSDS